MAKKQSKTVSEIISLPITAALSIHKVDVLMIVDEMLNKEYGGQDLDSGDKGYEWQYVAERDAFNAVTAKVLSMENLQHVARLIFPEYLNGDLLKTVASAIHYEDFSEISQDLGAKKTQEAVVAYVFPLLEQHIKDHVNGAVANLATVATQRALADQKRTSQELVKQGWAWNNNVLVPTPVFVKSMGKPKVGKGAPKVAAVRKKK